MKYHFIAIEGNIGAGKTTLATKMAMHYNATLLLEQFAENPFLPLFYENKKQFALPLELSFLKDRYAQLQSALKAIQNEQTILIADYSIFKSPLFAKNNLNEQEYNLFLNIHDMIKTTLPKPDLFIYLHTPIARLQRQIRTRGRIYEQQISDDYLIEIETAYLQHIQKRAEPLLFLDNKEADFNEPKYFNRLLEYLETEEPLPKGMVTL